MRKGLARLTLAFAAMVMACESPNSSDDARILPQIEPGATAGVAFTDTKPNLPYTVGDLIMCLSRPGRVVLDRIESKDPFGGLVLDAFAVIPNEGERGGNGFSDDNRNRTLSELGLLPEGPVVMDKQCPDFDSQTPDPGRTPQSVALLLQYSKPTEHTAGNNGIVIHYTSGEHTYQAVVGWEVVLCAPGDTTTENC